jgi:hypothetical protein
MDAALLEHRGMAEVVDVVRVPAVDHDVAGLEHVGDGADRLRGDLAGRNHDPDRARRLELLGELLERTRALRAARLDRGHRVGMDVVADAAVPVLEQPPDEPGAHAPEADHSELQGSLRCHRLPLVSLSGACGSGG